MSKRVALALAFVCCSSSLFASIATITNADFTSPTVATFDAVQGVFGSGTPYTQVGATFDSSSGGFYVDGTLLLDFLNSGNADLYVSFNAPFNLFGFTANSDPSITNFENGWAVLGVDFFSNNDFTGAIGSDSNTVTMSNSPQFYGLSNTSAFQSLVIHLQKGFGDGAYTPYLDDFKFEAAELTAAPEPASLALIGAGLTGVALIFRRRTRR